MILDTILCLSSATPEFKSAVREFSERNGSARVVTSRHSPAIKVRRVLAQLLSAEAGLEVDRVQIEARSGCSDFAGVLKVLAAEQTHQYGFIWDCRWRAEQEGWRDYFGFPDQIRAAREFDWRCFRVWQLLDAEITDHAGGIHATA